MNTTESGTSPPVMKPIIKVPTSSSSVKHLQFDVQKHIAYSPPQKVYKLTDIGYTSETGVSPIAASEPFQLFSKDAIDHFRAEIFQPEVMANCRYTGDLGAFMLRGYARKYAPFVYDAWHNPATLEIISAIAGVDLVPSMDFEVGHVNVSVKSEDKAAAERDAKSTRSAVDSSPVVGWHKDSYPFVCVTMLSDCANMIGGETAIRTADGQIMKIRGPTMGCTVVLQGRYITHQALRALGAQERITMVTSFRPKSAHLMDDTVLTTVRGISDLSELYYGFGEYRLAILEERIHSQLDKLRKTHSNGERTDIHALKQFMMEAMDFLNHTNLEMMPDEEVVVGRQPTMNLPNAVMETEPAKPTPVKAML